MARNSGRISRADKYRLEQERFRARYPNLQDPPTAATMRRWRQRAEKHGIAREDWEAALHSTGEFSELTEHLRGLEGARRRWKAAGSPWYNRDADAPSAPPEWGRSWGFYH